MDSRSRNPPARAGVVKDSGGVSTASPTRHGWGQTAGLFLILSLFWYLLSGRVGIQYFVFMITTVGIVMWMNPERPFRGFGEQFAGIGLRGRLRAMVYLVRYLFWLIWNVFTANVEVAKLILHPGMPIQPRLLTFRTTLDRDLARVLVANSITLTPGTVTVDLRDNEFLVHALGPRSAGTITDGILQNMVAPVFGEGPDPIPEVTWANTYRELNW